MFNFKHVKIQCLLLFGLNRKSVRALRRLGYGMLMANHLMSDDHNLSCGRVHPVRRMNFSRLENIEQFGCFAIKRESYCVTR